MFTCTSGTNRDCSAQERHGCPCHPCCNQDLPPPEAERWVSNMLPQSTLSPGCCGYKAIKLGEVGDHRRVTGQRLTCCSALRPGRSRTAGIRPCHCSGPSARAAGANITSTVTGGSLSSFHLTQRNTSKHSAQAVPDCPTTHGSCSLGCGSTPTSTNSTSLPALLPPC